MRPSTHEQKADFCRRFLASAETQETFCRRERESNSEAPSTRSLREWLRMYMDPGAFKDQARAVIVQAVSELQGILLAFDALDGLGRHVGPVDAGVPGTTAEGEPEAPRCQLGSRAEPEAPSVDAPAACPKGDEVMESVDERQPPLAVPELPNVVRSAHHLGGGPDQGGLAASGKEETPRRKRRGFFAAMLDDVDDNEDGSQGAVRFEDAGKRESAGSEEQAAVIQAPESSEPASELILPVAMPRPGACWG